MCRKGVRLPKDPTPFEIGRAPQLLNAIEMPSCGGPQAVRWPAIQADSSWFAPDPISP
jgi:hypothetical protein